MSGTILLAGWLAVALPVAGYGGEAAPTTMRWAGRDVGGRATTLPAADRVTVVVFLLPGQAQTERGMADVRSEVADAGAVRVVGVVSGPDAGGRAKGIDAERWPWPVAVDEDYACSGAFGVNAWPTVVVLDARGRLAGRVAGSPMNFRLRLAAYLDYAAGKLTEAQLEARLNEQRAIEDSADQKAFRHLMLLERFVAGGRAEDAEAQLVRARELGPTSDKVRLRLARAELLLGHGQAAADVLATVGAVGADEGEVLLLRGWSAQATERWDEARGLLRRALEKGADVGEAGYRLGLVYQHDGDAREAAEAFRRAFERTGVGRAVSTAPATRPGE